MGYRALEQAERLRALLATADVAALLEKAPQLGRLLRPLCRGLDIPLIEGLRLPRRSRAKRSALRRAKRPVSEFAPDSPPAPAVAPTPAEPPKARVPKPYTGDYSHLAGPTDPGFLERLKRAEERRKRGWWVRTL